MLKAKLLNSEASLNDYFFIEALEFVPGQNLTIALQLFDGQRNIRFIPPAAAELTLAMIDSEGAEFEVDAELIDADDRSMWKVELSQEQVETLAGQNIVLELDIDGDGD